MIEEILIKDIYSGSPNARDEIENPTYLKDFLNCFMEPPNFNSEDLLLGRKYFIEGYKGTGKTAVLGYLDSIAKQRGAMTSYLFFKRDYKETDVKKLEHMAISIMDVDNESLIDELDFEYIWRWIIFQKIIEDNMISDYKIFKRNKDLKEFEEAIDKLTPNKKSKSLFKLVPFAPVIGWGPDGFSLSVKKLEEENDNQRAEKEIYREFGNLVKDATDAFLELEKTEVPYYLFVDELEVYFEKNLLLERDLRMVRDLALTIKWFNSYICSKFSGFRMICTLRTEVKDSITRYVAGKEINKNIHSFTQELKWNYSNSNSYEHPLMQIWLKRIRAAEAKAGNSPLSDSELMKKWFVSQVNSTDIVKYILDNSWNKPRDIVRQLVVTNSTFPNEKKFDTKVLTESRKEYSKLSWDEAIEELNTSYNQEEIELIKEFLTGFIRDFTYEMALNRAKEKSEKNKNKVLMERLDNILQDLFRVGVLGNKEGQDSYRWLHKNDQKLITDDKDQKITVHRGLWPVLSLHSNATAQKKYKTEYNPSGFNIGDIWNDKYRTE